MEINTNSPVLFIILNRPQKTQEVFNAIKNAKPTQLFIAADGPRQGNRADLEKCRQTRKVVKNIDWPCTVKTLFHEQNLGCKKAVSSAIDWFFENVDEGIILEDDCLPDQSFFLFAKEMLTRYRENKKLC